MSEIAFCQMDLEHRKHSELAWRFLNGCLEISGDYEGLSLLKLYFVYRALVRSKVACLRMAQSSAGTDDYQTARTEVDSYLDVALRGIRPSHPFLAITHGVSGSGKSYGAHALAQKVGAIRIRSDVERKRIAARQSAEANMLQAASGLYSESATLQTYARLEQLATTILDAGYSVIVDATFLSRVERHRFRELAAKQGVPFLLLDFPESAEVCRARIRSRRNLARDPSDATEDVLDHQLRTREPLQDDEKSSVVTFDTLEAVVPSIATRLEIFHSTKGNEL